MIKQTPAQTNTVWWLVAIAVAALAIRIIYLAGLPSLRDSSEGFLPALHAGRASLYFLFQDGILGIFGSQNLRAVVAAQALADSFTVMAIGLAAMALSSRLAIPAAIVAAIIPNFIVHAAAIFPETLFLMFFSWGLCALLWSLRSPKTILLLAAAGILFGFALLTRFVLLYFPIFLVPVLIYALRDRYRSVIQRLCVSLIVPLLMILIASPMFIYNFLIFGYFDLSSQTGTHLLHWVYGCLATSWPCADRALIVAEITPIVAERVQSLGADSTNPFAIAAIERNLAIEYIYKLPVWQVALGYAWGGFKNLMQTGFYSVLGQYEQPLTFFSTIPGRNFFDRLYNFAAANKANYFMMAWVVAQVTLVLSRCVQLYGIYCGLRDHHLRAAASILLVTVIYFLALNGPIADPKYRIPMEPALIIFFALGAARIYDSTFARVSRNAPRS